MTPAPEIVVPLHSRRFERAQLLKKGEHLIPAGGLILGGVATLKAGAHRLELALAILGLATSALLIATIFKEARTTLRKHTHHHGHHGVDWADIFAAGVLFAEAGEKYHLTHHIAGPMILTALVTLGVGLMHGRLAVRHARRRSLRLGADTLFVGTSRFRSLTARWDDIARIDIGDKEAVVETRQGKRLKVNFADLENADDVRRGLEQARDRLQLGPATTPAEAAPGLSPTRM